MEDGTNMKKSLLPVVTIALIFFLGAAAACIAQSTGAPSGVVRGGTLRIIRPVGPQALGYWPAMGPTDTAQVLPTLERPLDMGENRELIPVLADSYKVDEKKLTITFHIRKGVKFHDGSDLNAEVVAWNYRMLFDNRRVQFPDKVKSIEVADPYTVVLHLTEYNNQMLAAFGQAVIFSKAAFDSKGKEWVTMHPVGTGPFEMVDFKRDAYIKFRKFEGYWRKGQPFLDAIEVRFIPDTVTSSAMMQAKEADMWQDVPVKDQSELTKKGLTRYSYWAGTPSVIYFNTANPKAPTANPKVREAVEYAIDKPALAKAAGFGFYIPLTMTPPPTEWGFDSGYHGRGYDPAQAKKLLVEAGYPNGLKLKLLALSPPGGRNTVAESIQTYLNQAGFNIDVDMADPGRFYGSLYQKGWDDMVLFMTGLDQNYLQTIQNWFGHNPRTKMVSFDQPNDFLALSRQSVLMSRAADQKEATRKMVRMIADRALVVPLVHAPTAVVVQPWVHTSFLKNGLGYWAVYSDWMEKH
jgi:ABC-type transport system substrate-binding protein